MREETLHNDGLPVDEANAPTWYCGIRRATRTLKIIDRMRRTRRIYMHRHREDANTTFILCGGYHYESTVTPGIFADKKESGILISIIIRDHKFKMTFRRCILPTI